MQGGRSRDGGAGHRLRSRTVTQKEISEAKRRPEASPGKVERALKRIVKLLFVESTLSSVPQKTPTQMRQARACKILLSVILSAQRGLISKIFHILRVNWLMDQMRMLLQLRKEESKAAGRELKDTKRLLKISSRQSRACESLLSAAPLTRKRVSLN